LNSGPRHLVVSGRSHETTEIGQQLTPRRSGQIAREEAKNELANIKVEATSQVLFS
jgi:hypothetical protein